MPESLSDIRSRAAALRARAAAVEARREVAAEALAGARARLAVAESNVAVLDGARALLTSVSDARREQVVSRVEGIVTEAVRAMLGPAVSFRLDASVKRGALSVSPRVVYSRGSQKHECDLRSVGGGVVDVVSFALRVVVLCLYRPALPRVLVADEPFKHVSESYLPAVAAMVSRLSRSLSFQFVLVSHEQAIEACADRVFVVSMDARGRSSVSVKPGDGDPVPEGDE